MRGSITTRKVTGTVWRIEADLHDVSSRTEERHATGLIHVTARYQAHDFMWTWMSTDPHPRIGDTVDFEIPA